MLVPGSAHYDFERAAIRGVRFGKFVLLAINETKVIQNCCNLGVLLSELLLRGRKRAPVGLLSRGVLPLYRIEVSEGSKREHAMVQCRRALDQALRLFIPSLALVDQCQVDQALRVAVRVSIFGYAQSPDRQRLGFRITSLFAIDRREIRQRGAHIGACGDAALVPDSQCAPQQRLRLGIFSLCEVGASKVVRGHGNLGSVRQQKHLTDLQCPAEHRFGIPVSALGS